MLNTFAKRNITQKQEKEKEKRKSKLKSLMLTALICVLLLALISCGNDKSSDAPGTEDGAPGAEEPVTSEGLTYAANSGEESYTVTGIGECTDEDVVIPGKYNGKPVTEIKSRAFENCTGIKKVTIPASITKIGYSAFKGCTGLTHITVPADKLNIGDDAFSGCPIEYASCSVSAIYKIPKNLLETVIITSVRSIGSSAFQNCTNLKSLTIADSITDIENATFNDCKELQYNEYDNAYYIGSSSNPFLFLIKAKDTAITSCETHRDTKYINHSAFSSCSQLTDITITNNVTHIGDWAFAFCKKLTSITLPNSVTDIGKYSFQYCTALTDITMSDNLESVDYFAFDGCQSLKNVHITNIANWCKVRFTSYGSNPLSYAHNLYLNGQLVSSLVIPEGVKSISAYTFSECKTIKSVTLPSSIQSLTAYAFYRCSELTEIIIQGSDLTYIGESAFYDCKNLTGITVPAGVTNIYGYTFRGCTNLTNITIPSTVKNIGMNAFYSCEKLESITFGGTKEQWNAIKKDNKWKYNSSIKTIHCTDGDIAL